MLHDAAGVYSQHQNAAGIFQMALQTSLPNVLEM